MKASRSHRETTVLDKVTHTFVNSSEAAAVLKNVSLTVRVGELTLLLGRSGSGKTTLLSLAAGLLAPSSGRICLFGRDLASYRVAELQKLRATSMGFVFQTFRLIESLSATQNVALVLEFAGRSRREACNRARELLSQLGMGHLAHRKPAHFSQGEKQRVAIARALANSPSLILADEPTACLESKQGLEIIRLLHQHASKSHSSVLVTSHDMRLREYADRVCYLRDGTLIEMSPNEPMIAEESTVRKMCTRPISSNLISRMRSSS